MIPDSEYHDLIGQIGDCSTWNPVRRLTTIMRSQKLSNNFKHVPLSLILPTLSPLKKESQESKKQNNNIVNNQKIELLSVV